MAVFFHGNKKALAFQLELYLFFISTNLSISFVCNFFSSSVGFNLCSCFFRLTLVFRLSLGLPVIHLPLSDLRCFRFLSSASVLDSDYSASALPFPSLPASASQLLLQCSPSAFASFVLPVLSGLISRAFLPGSGTQLCCSFLFALPCFTPTAVPQVLTFVFSAPLPFPFVLFRFTSGYSAFCFFLSVSSCFCLTVASSVLVSRFRFFRFPHSLLPDFSCVPSWFSYLAFCWFPFVLPCFAPAAVPQVIPF